MKRSDYRTKLTSKIKNVANALDDLMFAEADLNDILDTAVRNLFPDIYKLVETESLVPDSYGIVTMPEGVSARDVSRVYDDLCHIQIFGWTNNGETRITGLDSSVASYTLEYMTAFTMPGNDTDDADIPDAYADLVTSAAAVDCIQRMATGRIQFRGYKASGETGVDENEI